MTSFDSFCAIRVLVMDSGKASVTTIDLRNNEELVSLAHDEVFERRLNSKARRARYI